MQESTLAIDESSIVDRELTRLRERLGDGKTYRVCYLGGGDFLVHAMGIDPEMDRIFEIPAEKEDRHANN